MPKKSRVKINKFAKDGQCLPPGGSFMGCMGKICLPLRAKRPRGKGEESLMEGHLKGGCDQGIVTRGGKISHTRMKVSQKKHKVIMIIPMMGRKTQFFERQRERMK